ncbi:MAG: glycosyltransferase family 25 protein [Alphaproteobacteria bacterium]|nr:glycosyltransferase family 25 protein [Alphaproteobacteria bacterium]
MPPTQNFSALLLNLDRDVERRGHMEKQLAKAQVAFTRQSGILGEAVPDDLRSYFYDAQGLPKTTMKRGEIGCYASHLRALKRVASKELGGAVLIMEDDLELVPDFLDILRTALLAVQPNWDIIRLSCPPRRAYAPVARLDAAHVLARYSKIPNSAGAYLVTPAGAQKFLQRGVRGLTFDDDLRRPWFHRMETFGVIPPPAKAGVLKSTIDAIEAGRFDKGISSRAERLVRGDHLYAFKRLAYNISNLGPMNWLACSVINLVDMLAKPILGHSIIHVAARYFPARRNDKR